jgi:hypothetical protein
LDRPAVSFSPLYHHDDDLLPFGRFLVYVYLTRPREGRPGVDLYPDVEEGRGVEVYLNWEDACLGFLNEVSGDPELGRQALEGREVLLRDERRSDVLETARLPLLDCFATYWSEEEWPLYAVSAVTEDEEGAREAHRRALQAEAKGFHLGRGYLARLPRSFPWP